MINAYLVLLLLQAPAAPAVSPSTPVPTPTAPATGVKAHVVKIKDPYAAYQEGAFDQALQGFLDLQVEHPNDPALMLNVGSSHYQMKNYADAEKAFSQAALAGTNEQRQQALYNLGNCAYRQGKLDEALARYQAALELKPDDADAKFNIEFTRDEIRRRHEQAQKQQQENPQQPEPQSGEQQQGQDGQKGQQQPGKNEEKPGQNAGDPNRDSDHDGLSDAQEKNAANPTDPNKADTDGDGLTDGQEDTNKNGKVDPGETDPRKKDTDGDGKPDGQGTPSGKPEGQQPGQGEQAGEQPGGQPGQGGKPGQGMTREQAERYLDGLGDSRPKHAVPGGAARHAPGGKDW